MITVVDDDDDVYEIMRIIGDDGIISILQGDNVGDVTQNLFDRRPKAFLIEINI